MKPIGKTFLVSERAKASTSWLDCNQSALRLDSWLVWFVTYTTAVGGAIWLKSD